MEFFVETGGPYRLWARVTGPEGAPVVLLVMGAGASGIVWPSELVDALAESYRVVVYDHRDTGRSTQAFAEHPYEIADLAGDAVAVLDALGVPRAHVAGMSLGGTLVQLLMLDAPERLITATAITTGALGGGSGGGSQDGEEAPGIDPRLLELWEHLGEPRDREAELNFRVEHWRLLNGDKIPFDAGAFRALEEAVMEHAGTAQDTAAQAQAGQSGLERGAELASVKVPFLVIEGPEDPIYPPPNSARLASLVPGATLISVPGMGHALPSAVVPRLAGILLDFFAEHS